MTVRWFVFEDVENGCRRQVPRDAVDFAELVLIEKPNFVGRVQFLRELVPELSLGDALAVIRRAERLAAQS